VTPSRVAVVSAVRARFWARAMQRYAQFKGGLLVLERPVNLRLTALNTQAALHPDGRVFNDKARMQRWRWWRTMVRPSPYPSMLWVLSRAERAASASISGPPSCLSLRSSTIIVASRVGLQRPQWHGVVFKRCRSGSSQRVSSEI